MPVYTVHAPQANGSDIRATDRFAFVRDGFHFWAFAFGPLWLVWHRLWLALIGWIIVVTALDLALRRAWRGLRCNFRGRSAGRAADGIRGCEPCSAGRCRGATGVNSTSWSPMTRRPPSGGFSIAGPPSSAAFATINPPSIAADRRRPARSRARPSPGRHSRTISSDCFPIRELRRERCHRRLRLRKSALRRQGVRARGPELGRARKDHGDARSRNGVSCRSHRAARSRRLCRLSPGAGCARRYGRGDDGGRARQGDGRSSASVSACN